ncbi:MAG: HNH endonuclease [Candidatus Binatia bacterium]
MSQALHPEVAAILQANRFARFLARGTLPRVLDDAGTRLCGWCRFPLDRRTTAWCSDECADEFWIRFSRTHVARLVHRRDRGVCAICGLDTEQLSRIVGRLRDRSDRRWLRSGNYRDPTDLDAARWERMRSELASRGFGFVDRWHTPTLWEADHIVAIIEGGGCCGLENYRTLCVPCHRGETRLLRKRMRRQGSFRL